MKKEKKPMSSSRKKAIGQAVAEAIWIAIGSIFMLGGLTSLVLGTFIINMDGNYKAHPFYPIYEFQTSFFEWLKKWSKISLSSFLMLGLILVSISAVYLLIVLFIYANKKDAKDKKDKARKLREKNLKKFEQERLIIKDKKQAEEAAQTEKKAEEEKKAETVSENIKNGETLSEDNAVSENPEQNEEKAASENVTETPAAEESEQKENPVVNKEEPSSENQ